MGRYRCANCDITFETDDNELRCPECLRQHGIEDLDASEERTDSGGGKRRLVIAICIVLLLGLGAVGGLLLVKRATSLPAPGELGLLDPSTLRRTLESRGVSAKESVDPFEQNEGIRKLAAAAGRQDPRKVAANVAAGLTKLLARVHLDLEGSSDAPVRTAGELHRVLDEMTRAGSGQKLTAFPLELATLTVATLRAANLPALVCRVEQIKAKVLTAEVTAGIGRYVAAVYPEGKLGQQPTVVLDPARALTGVPSWAGGGGDPKMSSIHRKLHPLDDASAAAHLLALRGYRLRTQKPDQAYQLSDLALRAAAPCPTLHLIRAKVLAAAGGTKDAVNEAQKALAIKDGPPQRTLLALAQAGQGALGPAVSHLEQALALDASYWPAHQALATLLLRADPKRGLKYLKAGLEIAPHQPGLLAIEASRLMGEGKPGPAARVLEKVLNRRGPSEFVLLMLYQALSAAQEVERAKVVREQLLKISKDRGRIEKLLDSVDSAAASDSDAPPPPRGPPPRLKLPDVSLGK